MKKIKIGILMSLLASFSLNAQIITPIENAEEQALTQQCEQLIIGTWIGEGNTYNYRDVFHANGTMTDYTEGQSTETYYWAITTRTTPTGINISELIIQNTQDSNDEWRYEITALNDDIMNLLYNEGIVFSQTIYNKQ